ncbi:MAG: HEAT repeat domain-containing protein [Planctomycetes bacterium]|nr:HEAT repeat domain-containing protein [Planctomycetota bacterium]
MISTLALLCLLAAPAAGDADLAALARDARSKSSPVRLAAYDRLLALGPEGIRVLEPILRDAEEKARADFLAFARSDAAAAFRRQLAADIKEARKEALRIINDGNAYPDDAHGAVGQPRVDSAVAALRQLWLGAGRLFIEKVPEVNNALYYVREAARYLKRAGRSPNWYEEDLKGAYEDLNEVFDGMSLAYSRPEQKKIEELYEYNATCASTASDEERRFVRILNDYRVMLGLRCLEMDDRLVVACRKHSQEMQDLGYFAHESPVSENRTPQMRAAREGFGGGVGENCAVSGDAQDAFDGWYNSSGHHRLLVGAGAAQVGIGHSVGQGGARGHHWTLMAGSADSLRGKRQGDAPRLLYLKRAESLQPGDVETRFALARWCLKNDMRDEGRKLLEEVVALDAQHRKAHLLLGHVRKDGLWVTPEEQLLAVLRDQGAAEALAEAGKWLGAEAAETRLAALRVIEQTGDRKAVPLLVSALKDGASEVRAEACDALARLGATEAAGALAGLLGDRSFYVAHAAAAALWRLGDAAGVPALFKGLRSDDLNTRIDAHRKALSLFGRDFGYAWDLPVAERVRVVDEWEKWCQGQTPVAPGGK